VHVTFADADAFARWESKSLPTEAEWERAARGGLEGATYAWGDDLMPNGTPMANFWQGDFPHDNTLIDGWEGTSPIGTYAGNGYGLYDMIGNVWEWTTDWYQPGHTADATKACCVPNNPRGGTMLGSVDHQLRGVRIPRRVLKGGSHLCSANYCQRYRPAARFPEPIDTSTSHVGFRCVIRPSP
jgi:formylglycine-generating enzyme required for sulfatase activity